MMSVIIPANNEADYIGACLDAFLASDIRDELAEGPAVELIVVANGCTDATAAVSEGYRHKVEARGWRLIVLDLAEGGKLNALNAGERTASGQILVYTDADILVSPPLLGQLRGVLDRPDPAFAGGRPTVARARSWVTRAYARVWLKVPFVTEVVPGCGVFAMNRAGRARWDRYPQIIADDTFTRLQFSPAERLGVPASYQFPMPEGFSRLVRVRRRQDQGVAEVAREFPALLDNDDKPRMTPGRVARLFIGDPVGFVVYAAVAVAVKLQRDSGQTWARGR